MDSLEKRVLNRTKISAELTFKLGQIDEMKGRWLASLEMDPKILEGLKASVIVFNSSASARIEEVKILDKDLLHALKGRNHLTKGNHSEHDFKEAKGNAFLLGIIFSNYHSLKISEEEILNFHKLLYKFSEKNHGHAGRYKNSDNVLGEKRDDGKVSVVFETSAPYLIPAKISELCSWYNTEIKKNEIHPILIILNFIYEFLTIHPFRDGNGRLSRALTELLLLKNGYNYVKFIQLDPLIEKTSINYYTSLRNSQISYGKENEDIFPWINYMIEVLDEQARQARKVLEDKLPHNTLDDLQREVFELFMTGETLSLADIDLRLRDEVPENILRKIISKLRKIGLLKVVKGGYRK